MTKSPFASTKTSRNGGSRTTETGSTLFFFFQTYECNYCKDSCVYLTCVAVCRRCYHCTVCIDVLLKSLHLCWKLWFALNFTKIFRSVGGISHLVWFPQLDCGSGPKSQICSGAELIPSRGIKMLCLLCFGNLKCSHCSKCASQCWTAQQNKKRPSETMSSPFHPVVFSPVPPICLTEH